jgi:hypothetical protein
MARTAEDRIILATLKRGKVYTHFFEGAYHEFRQRVPVPVSEEMAEELEELVDVVNTDEGQSIEMDRFEIDRDATPISEEDQPKRTRLRLKMEEVPVKVRSKPKLKSPPAGFKKRAVG